MEISLAVIVVGTIGLLASFASGLGAGFKFFLIYLVGAAILSWVLSAVARRQLDVLVSAPPEAVAAAVRENFAGVGWKSVDGPGMFNFRARGLGMGSVGAKRPVVSVQIEDLEDGTTGVSIWTSSWHTQMGMMALCDRVVSKRFWLNRKLTELSNASALPVGGVAPPRNSSTHTASATSADKATLADPGLPEDHPRQLAHLLMTSVGLSFLTYGPKDAASCFTALSTQCPVLRDSEGYQGSDFVATFVDHPGHLWLAFHSQLGSAIAICVTPDGDSNFTTEHLAMPLRDLPAPWQWGIGTLGGTVPAGFARIVDTATIVDIHQLLGTHAGGATPPYPSPATTSYVSPIPPYGFSPDAAWAPSGPLNPSAWTNPRPAQPSRPDSPTHPLAQPIPPTISSEPPTHRFTPPTPPRATANTAAPTTPWGPPDGTSHPSPLADLAKKPWVIAGLFALVIAVIFAAITMLRSGTDRTSASEAVDGSTAAPAAAGDLSPCSTPPELQAQSAGFDNRGLTITTEITPTCSGGDMLSNSRFRVTAVDDDGHDVASGVFDLSSSPIAVSSAGTSAQLTFPAGSYWRTADAINGTLRLVAHEDGSEGGAAAPTAGSLALTAASPGIPESGNVEAAAQSALADIAAADRAYIDANLLDIWQPQLSSKYPGLVADGISWTAPEIVREHLELRQRFPSARLVWSPDWPVYNSHPQWWITLSGLPFGTGEQANGWCASQGLDADHCFAKMLSHNRGTSETTLFR